MELIASNEDANEVLSSSPQMSTVTFKTYEEITLDMPIDDSYKTTIYHTNIDIQPTRQSQQKQLGQAVNL